MDQLTKVFERLQQLQADTEANRYIAKSPTAILTAYAEFANELPELLLTLDQARIDWEDLTAEQLYIKEGNGEYSAV